MNSIRNVQMIRRHRRPVTHVTCSAVLAAIVVLGLIPTGTGLAQDKSRPSANPSANQNPGRGPSQDRLKAPVGHRQPTVQDLPSDVQATEGSKTKEDRALDEALRNICRGC